MICSVSKANDIVKILSTKDIAISVARSDIRKNLTNYRNGEYIYITLINVFLTREASRKYMKNNPCWALNTNDYKYILEEWQFKFEKPQKSQAYIRGADAYDKFGNLLCKDGRIALINTNKDPVIRKLKHLFEEVSRKEKTEPW